MVLQFKPYNDRCEFKAQDDQFGESNLTIVNPTDQFVAWRVRTTVPKCFAVKPYCGVLKPRTNITIMVMYRPRDRRADGTDRIDMRLLVLAKIVQNENVSEKEYEFGPSSLSSNEVMGHKLKVTFGKESSSSARPWASTMSMRGSTVGGIRGSSRSTRVTHIKQSDSTYIIVIAVIIVILILGVVAVLFLSPAPPEVEEEEDDEDEDEDEE